MLFHVDSGGEAHNVGTKVRDDEFVLRIVFRAYGDHEVDGVLMTELREHKVLERYCEVELLVISDHCLEDAVLPSKIGSCGVERDCGNSTADFSGGRHLLFALRVGQISPVGRLHTAKITHNKFAELKL